jgi:hypothetical protein
LWEFLYSWDLLGRRYSVDSKKPSVRSKQGTIYVTEVSAERGNLVKQITENLMRETDLVEKSDFVLIANQKNKTRKKLLDLD